MTSRADIFLARSSVVLFPNKNIITGAIFLALITLLTTQADASEVWEHYAQARADGLPLPVPDFAYAGYRRGESDIPDFLWPEVSVTDYGAIPDDGVSDGRAVRAAIDAAAAMDKAIVTFPPGRFLLSETKGALEPPLRIIGDHIVLRGAGRDKAGTELFFREHLGSRTPALLYSTPAMIEVSGSTQSAAGAPLTVLTAGNGMGAFTVTMDNVSNLEPGDVVSLQLDDERAASDAALAPYTLDPANLAFRQGDFRREYHRVDRINGHVVTFEEPLMTDIDARYRWTVAKMDWGTHFGLENMTLRGNWQGTFVHHQDRIHDSGWSAVSIAKYADSWVRHVRFIDWNGGLEVKITMNVTVRDAIIEGNRGHTAFRTQSSTGVLFTDVHDRSEGGQYHSLGVADRANGTVFHRSSWDARTTFDAHGGFPYATLYDVVEGGFSSVEGGPGGDVVNRPNHMENLVFWNFRHTGPPGVPFSWWKGDAKYYQFLPPTLIGWHGALPAFDRGQLAVNESFGKPVAIRSLYEAQLKLRFGDVPAWLNR